jgi:lipoate-protein ligase B
VEQRLQKSPPLGLRWTPEASPGTVLPLNINPDMSYWQGIIGCGIKEHPSTCLAEVLSPLPKIDKIIHWIIWAFGNEFQYDMIDLTNLEACSRGLF